MKKINRGTNLVPRCSRTARIARLWQRCAAPSAWQSKLPQYVLDVAAHSTRPRVVRLSTLRNPAKPSVADP